MNTTEKLILVLQDFYADPHWQLIKMRVIDGLSFEEIAIGFNISVSKARREEKKALAMLKKKLNERIES